MGVLTVGAQDIVSKKGENQSAKRMMEKRESERERERKEEICVLCAYECVCCVKVCVLYSCIVLV